MTLASRVLSIPIIRNNEILITEDEWTALKNNTSQEQIIQLISDAMDEVPMPMREFTHKEAMDDFEALRKLDTSTLIKEGKTYSRYEYRYPLLDKYIDLSYTGGKASDWFHQHNRYRCDSLNAPSPYRTWTTEKFRKNVLKNLFTMDTKRVDTARLRTCIALRNYIASQFRPSAAKALYDIYSSRDILDFSSGWGDRLAGFYAAKSTATYQGVDPNVNLQLGYEMQSEAYKSCGVTGKISNVTPKPAEGITFSEQYDTVFTSPPYFDTERYTQEDNQSWKRYKGVDKFDVDESTGKPTKGYPQKWLDNFLFVVIEKAWNALKPDGVMAINIADTYGHHVRTIMCDPMNDFISTLSGAEYQGAIGYRMAKRPNSAADKAGVFVEPIWIWKKRV
jgi:hypothetical protein